MADPTRRLLHLARPLRWGFVLSAALGLATVASGVGLLATAAYLIAAAALGPSIADLQVAIVGVRALGLARGLFRYLERYVSHNMAFRLLAELRAFFFARIEPRSPGGLDRQHSAELVAHLVDDIEDLQFVFLRGIVPPVVALLATLALAGLLLPISEPWAAVQVGLMILVGAVIPWSLHRQARIPSAAWLQGRGRLHRSVTETLQGMADILAFGQAGRVLGRLAETSAAEASAQRRLASIEAFGSGLATAVTYLSPALALWMLQPLAAAGTISGVTLVVLVITALASFEAVEPMAASIHGLAQSQSAAARVFEFIDAPPPILEPGREAPLPRGADLSVHDLHVRYPGSPGCAICGLGFDLPAGGRLAVIGPNGAGKSTLVDVLVRFRPYRSGRIVVGGVDLDALHGTQVRRLFGLVQQQPAFFSGTLRSNLLLANPLADDLALHDALRLADLATFVDQLPAGLDSDLTQGGFGLSVGQQRRLAIAQAVLHDGPLLLLDEPTAHLDPHQARDVLKNLIDGLPNRSILLITHDLIGLDGMDEIIVLEDGKALQRGTHQALLTRPGPYRDRWLFEQERAALTAQSDWD